MFIDAILWQILIPLAGKVGGMLKRFFQDEAGASAVEYIFVAALIVVVIVIVLTTLGINLSFKFSSPATPIGS